MKIPYKILLIGLFLTFNFIPLVAQSLHPQDWNVGLLVLNNQDTLQGKINFSQQNEYVYFVNKGQFRVFHWQNLCAMEFFDQQLNLKRYFVKLKDIKSRKVFFEKIVEGKYTLLKQVRRTFNGVNDVKNEYFDSINRFFIWDGKRVMSFQKFKKENPEALHFKPMRASNTKLLGYIYFINSLNQKIAMRESGLSQKM